MKTILVMGLRGKTGRQLATALVQHGGNTVRGAGRNVTDVNVQGVDATHFDWEDSATWPRATAGVHAVYLVKPKTADPAETVASFLRSASRIERVVLLSEIDGANRDESTDERRVERAVESSPFAWTILRPNWFMQNFTEPSFYLETLRDIGELKVPTGGQRTSFVDTRDIAEVAMAALLNSGHAGRAYTLTGPQALTWTEVARLIGQAAGHPIRYVDPPLNETLKAASEKGAARPVVEYYRRIYTCIRDGRAAVISGDVEQVTGHAPRSFAAFVEENKAVWRK
jgi:uncharacterized protein YbjT (DUF2867 family)